MSLAGWMSFPVRELERRLLIDDWLKYKSFKSIVYVNFKTAENTQTTSQLQAPALALTLVLWRHPMSILHRRLIPALQQLSWVVSELRRLDSVLI